MDLSSSPDEVIRHYSDMVFRVAYAQVRTKADADDIFQEVFIRYIRKAPIFEGEEHRKAWLIRVAINCSRKFWSSAWNKRTLPLDNAAETIDFTSPEETRIDWALRKIAPKYRLLIHLHYYEGYPQEQIGKLLKRKPSTIRTQLTRARKMLSELLKGEYGI